LKLVLVPLFLKIGITLTNFSEDGKLPVSKVRFIILVKILAISCCTRDKIEFGMLYGPLALLEFSEFIVFSISVVVTGLK